MAVQSFITYVLTYTGIRKQKGTLINKTLLLNEAKSASISHR